MENARVQIDTAELVKRINKKLAKDKHRLLKSRSPSEKSNLGDWYIINTTTKSVAACYSDIKELASETGALMPHEYFLDGLLSEGFAV